MPIVDVMMVIDQGTTSSRAILFDREGAVHAQASRPVQPSYPHKAWVEQDGEQIWQSVLECCREVIAIAKEKDVRVAGVGITNQRETTLLWDKHTGKLVAPAIVWQDSRTARACAEMKESLDVDAIRQSTGLVVDPYFSATKIAWMLEQGDALRAKAEKGELAFGTVECFLLWRLTGGACHMSDATNASRTLLYDATKGDWGDELAEIFDVPPAILPQVVDSAGHYGDCLSELFGEALPVYAMVGDQQAAAIGLGAIQKGKVKSTYGTGAFLLAHMGDDWRLSSQGLLSTVAWQLNGKRAYAMEGAIFIAGAGMQWLRDKLGVLDDVAQSADMAATVPDAHGVTIVPAFAGLGAPYWDADAKAAIMGLTLESDNATLVRAMLESMALQTQDVLAAFCADGVAVDALRVDGGMSANDWLMQYMAGLCDMPVERAATLESTALGAHMLAGLAAGWYGDLAEAHQTCWSGGKIFQPVMDDERRADVMEQWQRAIKAVQCAK